MVLSNTRQRGFLLVDVLIGMAVSSILVSALLGGVLQAYRVSMQNTRAVQAELLAVEMLEVARELEQGALAYPFAACVAACHLEVQAGEWVLVTGSETVLDRFDRALSVSTVYRDPSTHEVADTGTLDADTVRLAVRVSWDDAGTPRTRELESFAYDLYARW